MLDFNCGYNQKDASLFMEKALISNFEYFWFEELVSPDDLYSIDLLSSQYGASLAFGENHYGAQFDFLSQSGIKYLMPDLGRSLFFSELKSLSNTTNSNISLHNYSSGILLSNTCHVTLALFPSSLVEIDLSSNPLISSFYINPPEITDTYIVDESLPGNGCIIPQTLPNGWTHKEYCII